MNYTNLSLVNLKGARYTHLIKITIGVLILWMYNKKLNTITELDVSCVILALTTNKTGLSGLRTKKILQS